MSAVPTAAPSSRRDIDAYDAYCDHLLVLDHAASVATRPTSRIVGTYRLLRQDVAERNAAFTAPVSSTSAADRTRTPDVHFLELGRSCVLAPYRNKRTVELLWHGIWTYVLQHHVDVMIGCASLEGTDPDRLALPLVVPAPSRAARRRSWRSARCPHRYVEMDRLPPEAIEPKAALRALPPLIKGYLRLGATFGEGAVIDRQFGTTDVLVILPVDRDQRALCRAFRTERGTLRRLSPHVRQESAEALRAAQQGGASLARHAFIAAGASASTATGSFFG